jgi:hypothetical protein
MAQDRDSPISYLLGDKASLTVLSILAKEQLNAFCHQKNLTHTRFVILSHRKEESNCLQGFA